jgi:hypothetical protein
MKAGCGIRLNEMEEFARDDEVVDRLLDLSQEAASHQPLP